MTIPFGCKLAHRFFIKMKFTFFFQGEAVTFGQTLSHVCVIILWNGKMCVRGWRDQRALSNTPCMHRNVILKVQLYRHRENKANVVSDHIASLVKNELSHSDLVQSHSWILMNVWFMNDRLDVSHPPYSSRIFDFSEYQLNINQIKWQSHTLLSDWHGCNSVHCLCVCGLAHFEYQYFYTFY